MIERTMGSERMAVSVVLVARVQQVARLAERRERQVELVQQA